MRTRSGHGTYRTSVHGICKAATTEEVSCFDGLDMIRQVPRERKREEERVLGRRDVYIEDDMWVLN